MNYRDNTPTFNVNRKVVNFKDFSSDVEKEELTKMDRQNKPNSDEQQKNFANSRYKFNKVTRKMDDLSPAEVQDKLDDIDELEEGTNEEFNFNEERKISSFKKEIDSAFREISFPTFDTKDDRYNAKEPSIEQVIKNIEDIISKYK
jgi:hypothetical protein